MKRLALIVLILLVIYGVNTSAQVAARFDIVITEIFPDPTPSIGLPSSEFVEIMNVSAFPHNLKDWKIGDGSSVATITNSFILEPGSIAIICTNSASVSFESYGHVIGVANFPSLDNNADLLFLKSSNGTTIHAISYQKTWYKNDLKSDGGWSLEMVDTNNPCGGTSNWRATINATGGTPGKKNSIQHKHEDDIPPALIRTYAVDSTTIVAIFDEPVDSLSASEPSKYQLQNNHVEPSMANPVSPLFTEVILRFPRPFAALTVYDLMVSNITDCAGNVISAKNIVKSGLPSAPDTLDVIINEVLFNPKGDGFDFIELYNKSSKIIDLQHLHSANRNATGGFSSMRQLSGMPYLLFPGEFVVFTENGDWLRQNYIVKNDDNLLELPSLPSLPDDKGTLVIVNRQGVPIEEVQYDSKWHFALLENKEGISLERIDYTMPTQNKNNWTSAASTAGYGTPGYQNSQFKADFQLQGLITTDPKVFSPDNDGFDDMLTITYQMSVPGFVANITIFDANGKQVKYLAKNATLTSQGSFRWDGLDDNLQRLPVGIYIVFTEVFNLRGKTKKFKNALTLARKF
jgi:hypothetical protein